MKKKFLCTLFAVLMFTTSAYAQDIKININGNYIKTDAVCETKDNKMFVPISFIAGGLGGEIKWENSKAVITLGDSSIVFEPGAKRPTKIILQLHFRTRFIFQTTGHLCPLTP